MSPSPTPSCIFNSLAFFLVVIIPNIQELVGRLPWHLATCPFSSCARDYVHGGVCSHQEPKLFALYDEDMGSKIAYPNPEEQRGITLDASHLVPLSGSGDHADWSGRWAKRLQVTILESCFGTLRLRGWPGDGGSCDIKVNHDRNCCVTCWVGGITLLLIIYNIFVYFLK